MADEIEAWEIICDEAQHSEALADCKHGGSCSSPNQSIGHTQDLLPVLTVTSSNYAPVYAFWESSLDALGYPAAMRHVAVMDELKPPFGYCTESWREAIDRQLAEVVAWMSAHPNTDFLHVDADVQFFPRFLCAQARWLEWMRKDNLDMLFMRERTEVVPHLREGEVNAGFCLIRGSERTLRFWQLVQARQLQDPKMRGYPPYTDQYHLNRALKYKRGAVPQTGEFGVRWAAIPDEECIWSQPSSEEELTIAAFHHAVNTQDKPALLKLVREQVLAVQAMDCAAIPNLHGLSRKSVCATRDSVDSVLWEAVS